MWQREVSVSRLGHQKNLEKVEVYGSHIFDLKLPDCLTHILHNMPLAKFSEHSV